MDKSSRLSIHLSNIWNNTQYGSREDTLDKIEFLDLVAGLLTTFAFLPQAVKTWRTRSADDFSLPTLLNAGSWRSVLITAIAPIFLQGPAAKVVSQF
jgi:hypothetical protein